MFTMRFDMRAPETGAPIGERYAAAVEMADWGEAKGCISIQISEHHASRDGHPPAPFRLASAMAARTKSLATQPLCGGLPPKLGWESLELLASKVLPAIRDDERGRSK